MEDAVSAGGAAATVREVVSLGGDGRSGAVAVGGIAPVFVAGRGIAPVLVAVGGIAPVSAAGGGIAPVIVLGVKDCDRKIELVSSSVGGDAAPTLLTLNMRRISEPGNLGSDGIRLPLILVSPIM